MSIVDAAGGLPDLRCRSLGCAARFYETSDCASITVDDTHNFFEKQKNFFSKAKKFFSLKKFIRMPKNEKNFVFRTPQKRGPFRTPQGGVQLRRAAVRASKLYRGWVRTLHTKCAFLHIFAQDAKTAFLLKNEKISFFPAACRKKNFFFKKNFFLKFPTRRR